MENHQISHTHTHTNKQLRNPLQTLKYFNELSPKKWEWESFISATKTPWSVTLDSQATKTFAFFSLSRNPKNLLRRLHSDEKPTRLSHSFIIIFLFFLLPPHKLNPYGIIQNKQTKQASSAKEKNKGVSHHLLRCSAMRSRPEKGREELTFFFFLRRYHSSPMSLLYKILGEIPRSKKLADTSLTKTGGFRRNSTT